MPVEIPDTSPFRGLAVLIADDNLDAREIFTRFLSQAGALVSAVSSADEATRQLEHLRPDVVITDLWMPDHDGLWLLKWIRERDAARETYTPVIAVTARTDVYDTADLRFDSCHVKPVAWSELAQAILVVTNRAVPASP
jgi:CheY-like chemotaxis protein